MQTRKEIAVKIALGVNILLNRMKSELLIVAHFSLRRKTLIFTSTTIFTSKFFSV